MSARAIRNEKKIKAKQNRKMLTCFLLVFFCAISVLLVMQRNQINKLDMEINAMQDEYDTLVKLNDDLQGQILTARNFADVESYASRVLGMVPSNASQVAYVSYNSYTSTASAKGVTADAGTVMAWLSGLFK